MITACTLKKAGFVAGEWGPFSDRDRYRTWTLEINDECAIEVDEEFIDGETNFYPSISSDGYVPLKIEDVTKLLTLKDLLK